MNFFLCNHTINSQTCEPLKMSEIPKSPWHTLALNLKGPFPCGTNLLVIIDYHSRYPVVASLKSTTAENIVNALEKTFNMFGYPREITTDNGPQLVSNIFKDYFNQHDIKHRMVTPY